MPFSCQVIGGADSERATVLRALRECGCLSPEGDAPADLVVRLSASEPPPRVRDWLLEGGPLVLALLPREDPEIAAIALASGADDFLIWPRDKPLLRARLAVLERRRDNRRMRRESDRRAADERLREADERYRLLFATVPDPIAIIEPSTARVLEVNDAFCRLYGWSPDEARELTVWDVAANPDSARLLIRAALEKGVVTGAQRWTRRKDGSRILAELNVVRFRMQGRDLLCAVGRDVSERHRLAQELVLRDRLATVGTLAAGAAHEINNPLAYLFSNLSFVEEEVARAAPALRQSEVDVAELLRALGEARQGAERIRDTVRDLKTFARPGLPGRGRVDVRRVLEVVLRMAGSELQERARLVPALEEVPLVEGDESSLGQVFLNLLTNAAQALEGRPSDQGELRVATRLTEAGEVLIEVRDNGRGMEEEEARRAFEPFFTTRPVGGGAGLGLSVAHGIISSLGGRIEVETAPGQGTTFRVFLPVAARAPPTLPGDFR